jgi:Type II/IV secretion system protein
MATLSLKSTLKLDCEPQEADEYTEFIDDKNFRERLSQALPIGAIALLNTERSFDFQGSLSLNGKEIAARVHAAQCFSGEAFSVTIRRDDHPSQSRASRELSFLVGGHKRQVLPVVAFPVYDILYEAMIRKPSAAGNPKEQGLILVSGATGSGKTKCLNALVARYVADVVKRGSGERRPHVVVIGDPIETFLYGARNLRESRKGQEQMKKRSVDFTPRTLRIDVVDVESALKDALRETPTVVVVSELRTDNDFEAALRFAATGHLILATSHNTSLVDAFGKLLDVGNSENASHRSSLVQRLRAVVHLVPIDKWRVPVLWRSTPSSRQNFISEGLSSILPATPGKDDGYMGVLGRHWMLRMLAKTHKGITLENFKEALSLDLAGR